MDDITAVSSKAEAFSMAPASFEIEASTVYLTFNKPKVDDCHRGILVTTPSTPSVPPSGILFHAEHDSASTSKSSVKEHARSGKWSFQERTSRNPAAAQSLLYALEIGKLHPCEFDEALERMRQVLKEVPIGREERERVLGKLGEGEGNPALEGYDCVVWTVDALRLLDESGVIRLGKEPNVFMAEARKSAWPGDIAELVAQSAAN